jgi:hypothetical protein
MLQPGLMMDQPLLLSSVIEHAAAQYGDVEVVSRETHGPLFATPMPTAPSARASWRMRSASSAFPAAARSARSPGTTTATWRRTTRSPAAAW